jgi:hypothetical protein
VNDDSIVGIFDSFVEITRFVCTGGSKFKDFFLLWGFAENFKIEAEKIDGKIVTSGVSLERRTDVENKQADGALVDSPEAFPSKNSEGRTALKPTMI